MRKSRFFRPKEFSEEAHRMYFRIVEQSRLPVFYLEGKIPDTIDGRFELIVLHVFMVLERFREEGEVARVTGQELFDVMFADLDQSLREMGVGDMGIGKRIKKMGQAFYGRVEAYSAGLEGPEGALEAALARNLYGTVSVSPVQLSRLAGYVREQIAALRAKNLEPLIQGHVEFGEPVFS